MGCGGLVSEIGRWRVLRSCGGDSSGREESFLAVGSVVRHGDSVLPNCLCVFDCT